MSRIKCFVIVEADHYTQSIGVMEDGDCPRDGSAHRLHSAVLDLPKRQMTDAGPECPDTYDESLPWPTHCPCGHEFTGAARRYSSAGPTYRRADGEGGDFQLRDAEPGALWRTPLYEDVPALCGADGESWWCKTPGGEWHIDGRASNCTMKDDNVHKCWVRHGTAPDFTIDKDGNTCSAGAGSILCGEYHGFLRNGYLEP